MKHQCLNILIICIIMSYLQYQRWVYFILHPLYIYLYKYHITVKIFIYIRKKINSINYYYIHFNYQYDSF